MTEASSFMELLAFLADKLKMLQKRCSHDRGAKNGD